MATPERTTSDLIEYAADWGLRVAWAVDLAQRGRYIPARRLIVVRYGMTARRTHSTLAHEIAHSFWHDRCSTQVAEQRAWGCAAQMLIDAEHYAAAEALHPAPGAIAAELRVTVEVVCAYREQLVAPTA